MAYLHDSPEQVSCDGSKNPELIVAGLSDRHFANFHLAVTDVALAYWYTGNTTFAEFGANLTRVFFVDPTTRMNPHLKYAQLQPGVCYVLCRTRAVAAISKPSWTLACAPKGLILRGGGVACPRCRIDARRAA